MHTTFFKKMALGASLMSMLVNASLAHAQIAPGAQSNTMTATPTTSAPSGQRAPRTVNVIRNQTSGQLEAVRWGEYHSVPMTMEQFIAQYTPNSNPQDPNYVEAAQSAFQAVEQTNEKTCGRAGNTIRRAIDIASKTKAIDARWVEMYGILAQLGRKQNSAAHLQMGAAVVSTGALCALSAGLYCLAAAAGGLGNLFTSGAYKKTQKVDREMRFINADQSRLQLEAMGIWSDAMIFWAEEMQGWCLIAHPGDTLGGTPAAS